MSKSEENFGQRAPVLGDLDDFVKDLDACVEDQLVRFGFQRNIARLMISRLSNTWRLVMQENME